MRQYLLETNRQSDIGYIFLQISRQRSDVYWLPNATGHTVDFIVDGNMFFPQNGEGRGGGGWCFGISGDLPYKYRGILSTSCLEDH